MIMLGIMTSPLWIGQYFYGEQQKNRVGVETNADAIDSALHAALIARDKDRIKLEALSSGLANLSDAFAKFKEPGRRFSKEDWERERDRMLAKMEFQKLEILRIIDQLRSGIPPEEVKKALKNLNHRVTVLEIKRSNTEQRTTP